MESAIANKGKLSKDDLEAKKSLENLIGREINIEEEIVAYQAAAQQAPTQQAPVQQAPAATVQQNPTAQGVKEEEEKAKEETQKKEKKRESLADMYRSMGLIPQASANPTYSFGSITGYNTLQQMPQFNGGYQQMPQIGGGFITCSQYAA